MDLGLGRAPGLGWSQGAGCAVCGSTADCNHRHDIESVFTTKGWEERGMPEAREGQPIYAEDRIFEDDRLIYAAGDVVPYADAVRLGLVPGSDVPPTGPEPAEAQPASADDTAANRAAARARRQTADRQVTAPEDRSA